MTNELLSKGQWVNRLLNEHGTDLTSVSCFILDDILERYDDYLIDNQTCPQCYGKFPEKLPFNVYYHAECGWGME